MKISIFKDDLFAGDMAWGFRQLGHEVELITPHTIEELDDILSKLTPDLLISQDCPGYYNQKMLEHLGDRSASNMKCVHWDTDGIFQRGFEMRHVEAMKPDLTFTICPDMLEVLRSQNIRCELIPIAYNPEIHSPGPVDPAYECDISYSGGAYPGLIGIYPQSCRRKSVEVLFGPLLKGGYRIDFYGDNRQQDVAKSLFDFEVPAEWLHGRHPYQKTCQIYRSSRISLVTQNYFGAITKRLYEVMGSGGFALSYDNDAVRKVFTPGKDLVVSSSPEQTIEIIEYYKKHEDEYRKIRKNAVKSVENHTYKQWAQHVLELLGNY